MAESECNGIVPSWFCYLVPALSTYCVMGLERAFWFHPTRWIFWPSLLLSQRRGFFQCASSVLGSAIF